MQHVKQWMQGVQERGTTLILKSQVVINPLPPSMSTAETDLPLPQMIQRPREEDTQPVTTRMGPLCQASGCNNRPRPDHTTHAAAGT